jgi:hypothetical protein
VNIGEIGEATNDRFRFVLNSTSTAAILQFFTDPQADPQDPANEDFWEDQATISAPGLSAISDVFARVTITNINCLDIRLDLQGTPAFVASAPAYNCPNPSQPLPLNPRERSALAIVKNLEITPNPFSNLLQVQLPLEQESPLDVTLVNSLGQIVRSQRHSRWQPGESLDIDTADLAPGMYLLSVQTTAGRQTRTLYKY